MRQDIQAILHASNLWLDACSCCSCPALEFAGDTDRGILTVRCPECGETWERKEPLQAVEWWLRAAADAIRRNNLELADGYMKDVHRFWLTPSIGRVGGFAWVITVPGTGLDINDDLPF